MEIVLPLQTKQLLLPVPPRYAHRHHHLQTRIPHVKLIHTYASLMGMVVWHRQLVKPPLLQSLAKDSLLALQIRFASTDPNAPTT